MRIRSKVEFCIIVICIAIGATVPAAAADRVTEWNRMSGALADLCERLTELRAIVDADTREHRLSIQYVKKAEETDRAVEAFMDSWKEFRAEKTGLPALQFHQEKSIKPDLNFRR